MPTGKLTVGDRPSEATLPTVPLNPEVFRSKKQAMCLLTFLLESHASTRLQKLVHKDTSQRTTVSGSPIFNFFTLHLWLDRGPPHM